MRSMSAPSHQHLQIVTKILTSEIHSLNAPCSWIAFLEYLDVSRMPPGSRGHDVTKCVFEILTISDAFCKCQVPGCLGAKCQVECHVLASANCQVPSAKGQVPSAKCQMPSAKSKVLSAKCQVPSASAKSHERVPGLPWRRGLRLFSHAQHE